MRREDEGTVSRFRRIVADSRHRREHPFQYRAVGVMVEGIHARVSESLVERVRVPAFPHGGCALVDRIEPGRITVLEQQGVGDVRAPAFGKRVEQDRRAEESGREFIAMFLDIRQQGFQRGGLRFRRRVEIEEEREEEGRLRLVLVFDRSVRFQISGAEVGDRLFREFGTIFRDNFFSEGRRHFRHHPEVPDAVGGDDDFLVLLFVPLKRKPVAVTDVRRFRIGGEAVDVLAHRGEVLAEDGRVAVCLPHIVGDDDAGVRPADAPVASAVTRARRRADVLAVRGLGVAQIAHEL